MFIKQNVRFGADVPVTFHSLPQSIIKGHYELNRVNIVRQNCR